MSNGKQLDRSINMLRPMEINGPDDTKEKQEDESEERIRSAKERSAQTKTAYSYGWLGVRCQSTINFVLIKGEIFFYEGRGLVSNLDDTDKCMIQKGECMINTSTVLWNSIEVINHCPYKRIGRFDTIRYGNHFIIKELQSLFILDNETHSSTMKNCKFNNPYPMKGYIILEKNTREERNFTTNSTQETTNQLLMMETSPEETPDPNNVKLQYAVDSLRQEFIQQLEDTYQRSCQNRNNLLYYAPLLK
uniref:Uncharacterized protein n=1 Tax=Wuchereria bancrofti TaxID=6293 RepID=A0A1I8EXC0_WUCBA